MAKPKAEYRASRVKAPTAAMVAALGLQTEEATADVVPIRAQDVATSKRLKPVKANATSAPPRVRKPRVPKQLTDGRQTIAITLHLSPELHKRLRLRSVEEDMPISHIVEREMGSALGRGGKA